MLSSNNLAIASTEIANDKGSCCGKVLRVVDTSVRVNLAEAYELEPEALASAEKLYLLYLRMKDSGYLHYCVLAKL